jgi:putative addiction module component (TIGR02574 family)
MASAPVTAPPGFNELSIEEKLDYLEALWARVVAKTEQIPAPDWQRRILAERLAAYRSGNGSSRPWSEFRDEMRSILRSPTR